MQIRRGIHGAVAALAIALLAPTAAHAQFSAISVGNVLENAPIFTPSALVLDRGGVSVRGGFLYAAFDDFSVDVTNPSLTELFGQFAYGVSDALTLGAFVPYLRASADVPGSSETLTGLGDIGLFGQGQFWRSGDGLTKAAAFVDLTLPTASGDFDQPNEPTDVGIGAAVSHDVGATGLHGSAEYTFETGDFGVNVLSLTGAAVFTAGEKTRVSGEVEVDVPEEGDTQATLAGGVRILATPTVFIDVGALAPVTDNLLSAALVAAVSWTR